MRNDKEGPAIQQAVDQDPAPRKETQARLAKSATRSPKPIGGAFPARFRKGVCPCCDELGYWVDRCSGGLRVKCNPCGGTGRYEPDDTKPKAKVFHNYARDLEGY